MREFTVKQVGTVGADGGGMYIQLEGDYLPALAGIEGFGYLNVLWWFDGCDNCRDRETLRERAPYRSGPEFLGVFATRSPRRPNPLGLSCVEITRIDGETGRIGVAWIDADCGTPVLDIKPYTPSLDRVESPAVPDWCGHWPASMEESGEFDWASEFNG